jgi:transposase-like protein
MDEREGNEGGDLNPAQEAAIEWLTAGETLTDVARLVGVNRSTLYRWRASHTAFRVELRRRGEERRSAIAQLVTSADRLALSTLIPRLRTDAKLALAYLRARGAAALGEVREDSSDAPSDALEIVATAVQAEVARPEWERIATRVRDALGPSALPPGPEGDTG